MKSVKKSAEETEPVQSSTDGMIDGILGGQSGAGLQLIQLHVHLPLPLNSFGDRFVIAKFPESAKARENVNALFVSIKDGKDDEGEEEDGLDEQ